MASTSDIQSHVDAELPASRARSPSVATRARSSRRGDTDHEAHNLPDAFCSAYSPRMASRSESQSDVDVERSSPRGPHSIWSSVVRTDLSCGPADTDHEARHLPDASNLAFSTRMAPRSEIHSDGLPHMASSWESHRIVDTGRRSPRRRHSVETRMSYHSWDTFSMASLSESRSDLPNIDWQREGMPDTDFNRTYPPDPWGKEAGPTARVWKVYRDQKEVSHSGMLHGWNKTLDVLLIFAGLFSAVLTAFLIESYKALQPDYTQYVAAFLYATAVSQNRTGGVFPALDAIVAPDLFIQTSAAQRWTNGLWFSSLVISLAVALLCILIKQWLDAYDTHVSSQAPSTLHWARRHSLYHHGLKKWGVPALISFLPLLLHLSLFLFFVGLVLFLHPLDGAISSSLLGMVSCICAFYVLSLILPAWRVECPSYTPLLAQVLLAVSRAIWWPLYVVRSLRICIMGKPSTLSTSPEEAKKSAGLLSALSAWIERAEEWLKAIQLRARERLARESQAIFARAMELDGYVLGGLIQLPVDTNLDVVSTALVALGAVTSTRTRDVISRKVHDVIEAKILDCYKTIQTDTGFAITSRVQLRRAHRAMCGRVSIGRWQLPIHVDSLSSLGIDNLLLDMLDAKHGLDTLSCSARLIPRLQSLPPIRDRSQGFPLRSTCLDFLEQYPSLPFGHPFPTSITYNPPLSAEFSLACFLLVFCAGHFGSADMDQLGRALRSVKLVLSEHCSITIRVDNDGELDHLCAVVNGLWTMLAQYRHYHMDTRTAQIVADYALVCFKRVSKSKSGFSWAQLSGLSIFSRSYTFAECMGDGDRILRYASSFSYWEMLDRAEVRLDNYWEYMATLMDLCWNRVPPARRAFRSACSSLFPVKPSHRRNREMLSEGGPYATLDDMHEPALMTFLNGPEAITAWIGASPPDHNLDYINDLADLAYRISIVLCRRKRLGRANDTFVPSFFSETFVLARFWDLVYRHLPLTNPAHGLAKHCLKLAPERFMAICTQLEETETAGSELRARAVELAKTIREGCAPGGALSAECDADCPCMIEYAREGPKAHTRWDAFVARIRRRRSTEPVPSSNV